MPVEAPVITMVFMLGTFYFLSYIRNNIVCGLVVSCAALDNAQGWAFLLQLHPTAAHWRVADF